MIEKYKRQDGEALGAKKASEGSGESEGPKWRTRERGVNGSR
jgi:hypothetical protein